MVRLVYHGILEVLPDLKYSHFHQLTSVTIVFNENVGTAEALGLNEACSDGATIIATADTREKLQCCDIKLVLDVQKSDYVRVEHELKMIQVREMPATLRSDAGQSSDDVSLERLRA